MNGDALDKWAVHREDTLNTYITRHFTNCEALFVSATMDADYITTELLNTLFVTFFDAVRYSDLVTSLKRRKLFLLTGKCLFGNLH